MTVLATISTKSKVFGFFLESTKSNAFFYSENFSIVFFWGCIFGPMASCSRQNL